MKYKVYVFDFDYTLADATQGIVSCMNYALNCLKIESSSTDAIRRTVGMTLKDAFHILTGIDDEVLAASFTDIFIKKADKIMTESTVLFADTISTLTTLKEAGAKTAIVTSKFRYRIEEVLDKYSIGHLVDYVVGYEDVTEAKPAPEGLYKSIDWFSADKADVLYIGDSIIDAQTAAFAGVDFVGVTTGTTEYKDFLPLPHKLIVRSLSELIASDMLILRTERLYLRKIQTEDYASLCEILQDAEVMYAWEHGFSDDEVTEWINKNLARYDTDGYSYWSVIEKSTDRLVGLAGLIAEQAGEEKYVGLGYIFGKEYWGRGYAFESATACVDYARDVLKLTDITAQIRPENAASRKLAEKLGMTVKGQFVKHYMDKDMIHLLYSKNF